MPSGLITDLRIVQDDPPAVGAYLRSLYGTVDGIDAATARQGSGDGAAAIIARTGAANLAAGLTTLAGQRATAVASIDTVLASTPSARATLGATFASGQASDLASRTASTITLNTAAIATADAIDTTLATLASQLVTLEGQVAQIRALRVVSADAVTHAMDPSAVAAAVYAAGMARFFALMGSPGNAMLGSAARTFLKL